MAIPGDLSNRTNCVAAVEKTVSGLGGIDILVNTASRQVWADGLLEISDEAYQPSKELLDYALTNAAFNNFAKGLSGDLLPSKGIRVNAVAPGPIWTVMQPAELAGAYVFLASEDASYMSGETLSVTGGALTP